jgi:hypothetical protein
MNFTKNTFFYFTLFATPFFVANGAISLTQKLNDSIKTVERMKTDIEENTRKMGEVVSVYKNAPDKKSSIEDRSAQAKELEELKKVTQGLEEELNRFKTETTKTHDKTKLLIKTLWGESYSEDTKEKGIEKQIDVLITDFSEMTKAYREAWRARERPEESVTSLKTITELLEEYPGIVSDARKADKRISELSDLVPGTDKATQKTLPTDVIDVAHTPLAPEAPSAAKKPVGRKPLGRTEKIYEAQQKRDTPRAMLPRPVKASPVVDFRKKATSTKKPHRKLKEATELEITQASREDNIHALKGDIQIQKSLLKALEKQKNKTTKDKQQIRELKETIPALEENLRILEQR